MLEHLIIPLETHTDDRGTLTVTDFDWQNVLPFKPHRAFWINGVPDGGSRGVHANKTCCECIIAVSGSFSVVVDDGLHKPETFCMHSPSQALLIPPYVWCELSHFTADAVCLCFASGSYDRTDYIEDYQEFLQLAKAHNEAHIGDE